MISYFATVSVSVVVLGPEDDNILGRHITEKEWGDAEFTGVTVCCLPFDTEPQQICTYACYLFLDELQLHVLDLDSDQQEVDLPHDHVFKVVPQINKHRRKLLSSLFFRSG